MKRKWVVCASSTVNMPWFFHLINCSINSKILHNLYFEILLHKLYVYSIFFCDKNCENTLSLTTLKKTIRFSEHCFFTKTMHRFKVHPHIITKVITCMKKVKVYCCHTCHMVFSWFLLLSHLSHVFSQSKICHSTLIRLKHKQRTDNI